ncbi:RusA family crossover junction endodeoxyribonuclease [Orrella sp. JC864]|uniref:RusA family crossover junction endodeoxyribonuclease n=1 Tax=Orrella sp. JC864 TaxID=3120298 RepID=UPI0030099A23
MANQIVFTVPGAPKGKGRAKSTARIVTKGGKPLAITRHYTPQETAAYMSLVRLAAAQAMAGRPPYTGPIQMHIQIVCPVPASWSLTRRRRALAGEIMPTVKPDSDNVEKAVKDGMNGVVYRDDVQVVDDSKSKRYGEVAGVTVTLTEMEGVERAQGKGGRQ